FSAKLMLFPPAGLKDVSYLSISFPPINNDRRNPDSIVASMDLSFNIKLKLYLSPCKKGTSFEVP
ncbi:MAG: hypothetical protein J6Z05_00990, partial [Lachnospiraceae bacterium]|nr:hypothetical protein [Lachnospiraceae bacterium]